jgi:hypothetical protein
MRFRSGGVGQNPASASRFVFPFCDRRQIGRFMRGSSWKRALAVLLALWRTDAVGTASPNADRLWAVEPLEPRQLLSAAPGLVPIGVQPEGSLSGKIAYVSAGHGWQWSNALNRWATDRPNLLSMVEDFGNQDQMTYYADYLLQAGATVVPMRPVGRQLNEIVLDNDSPGVTWSGPWSNNTAGPRWYDEDYGATSDPVKYRFANINSSAETAVATYSPEIPQAGHYPVYAWVAFGANRTNQLYKVNHTGGQTQISVDHRRVGNGWVYLGTYFFDEGQSAERGSVQISNFSTDGGSVVIADAIRFGNGMGDVPWGSGGIGTGNVSGYPREDEGSIVWLWRGLGLSSSFSSPSSVIGTSNVSAPLRMAAHMNSGSNPYGTSIYVGFHSNATTGNPNTAVARGAIGLLHSGSPTPNQLALATAMGRQINVDMRALNGNFQHDWSNRTTYTLAGSYGEINNQIANNKFDATIVEVAFHDNIEDSQLMRDPKVRDQLARSTYEATLEHLHFNHGATPQPANVTLPSPPELRTAISNQSGEVTLSWTPGPSSTGGFNGVHGDAATGFRVFASVDGYGFDGGTYVAGGATGSVTLSGYDPSVPYYFKVVAENTGGRSTDSEVLTVIPSGGDRPILVVNGFDRKDFSQNFKQSYAFGGGITDRVWSRFNNSRDYVVQVHQAIADSRPGLGVDSASNEAVISGQVILNDYTSVIWILGNESVQDQTFDLVEQAVVTNFINDGGNFFVSGSEIAYDLDFSNNGRTFVRNVLGAAYVADNAATRQAQATQTGIFDGLSPLEFSSGDQFSSLVDQLFNVAFPDVVNPVGVAAAALDYQGGTGGVAGIQKEGQAGAGNVVLLGFPFESIAGAATRAEWMQRVLDFFGHQPVENNAVVVGSHIYHADSVFAESGFAAALDPIKRLAKESDMPQMLSIENLISSSRGINGIAFDIEGAGGQLTASDFLFQMSPAGAFDSGAHPPESWQIAPQPESVTFLEGTPSRVVLLWPNQAIANRWLRISLLANPNTRLAESQVFYLGHLLGEVTGDDQGVFTVTFADISQIRSSVGQVVDAGSSVDIDKNGVVAFSDIVAMRSNIAAQLSTITIPAAGGSGAGAGSMPLSAPGDFGSGSKTAQRDDSRSGIEAGSNGLDPLVAQNPPKPPAAVARQRFFAWLGTESRESTGALRSNDLLEEMTDSSDRTDWILKHGGI